MELRFNENWNDYLIYGLDFSYVKKNRKIFEMGLERFYKEIKGSGALVYQAHPFRTGNVVRSAEFLHGIEINNGGCYLDNANDLARQYAQVNNLPGIGGGDFHGAGDEGRGGIIVQNRITTVSELLEVLINSRYEVE